MSKITLEDLASIQNDPTAVDTINDNSAVIVSAFDNTLSRDGSSPNQMNADLDMNSKKILNLPAPRSPLEPARLKDIGDAPQYAADAAASAAAAEADRILADADVVLTHADVVLTHADVVSSDANATAAQDSADDSAASAAAALVSENNAATSETNAASSASAASTSASNAHTSEINSAASASSASTSASNASTSETNAAASATSASGSASTATTQAGIATTQAGISTTQAGIATTQASNASASASAAATSEGNASTSETNAAASASTASTAASNASTSETNAAASESAATTSASNAATSETNAATSETNAAISATDAQNTFEDFENIYLGSYASDPSTTPTGGTITEGMLYWNSSLNALMIFDGALWGAYSAAGGAVASVFGRTGVVTATTNDYNFNQLAGNIATTQMNSGTGASSTTFWRGDGTWVSPAGGVTSVFGRTGAITAATNDYTFAQIGTKPTTTTGYGITDAVSYDVSQTTTATQRETARSNIYAAPFDALAYNGMQLNGSMDVSQENGGSAVAFASGSVSKYVVDEWVVSKTGTNVLSAQRTTSVFPDFDNELKLSVSTAQASIGSDYIVFEAKIEGFRFARARWGTANAKPVTIGFWLKSSVAGALPIYLYNSASTVAASSSVTIAAANTAQFVTVTFAAQTTGTWDKTNGIGCKLNIFVALSGGINIAATVGNTFEITGLIVLPGIELPNSDRLPFIMRPFDQEESNCLRQYQTTTVGLSAQKPSGEFNTGTRVYDFQFKRRMRTAPTMSGNLFFIQVTADGCGLANTPAGTYIMIADARM